MARIIITSDQGSGDGPRVLLAERVLPEHFDSEHFSTQLVERVGWAVLDAHDDERRPSQ